MTISGEECDVGRRMRRERERGCDVKERGRDVGEEEWEGFEELRMRVRHINEGLSSL
jgi:hypothetical protein